MQKLILSKMQHNKSDKRGVKKTGNEVSIAHQKSHTGILPAPEDLQHYNELIPNGAERFMAMAEREQMYRHQFNKTSQNREFISKIIGQITGIVALLILSYFFISAVNNGATDSSLKYIGFAIMGIVALFVTGKLIQRKSTF